MPPQYASVSKRVKAFLIDLFILLGIFALISLIVAVPIDKKDVAYNFINALLQMISTIGYLVFFQYKYGQTIGKRLIGIKVIDLSGNTPNLITLFLREVIGKFLSTLTLGIGYFIMIKAPNSQALHDKIANTFVVNY